MGVMLNGQALCQSHCHSRSQWCQGRMSRWTIVPPISHTSPFQWQDYIEDQGECTRLIAGPILSNSSPTQLQCIVFGRPYCVICLSVTFCIVAKRYVLAKNCLKEWIENQGQRVAFLGRRHISTSGFASTATETAVFALFLPIQPSDRY